MPYVGIRQTARGYRVTDPLSVDAVRTYVPDLLLNSIMQDQNAVESQELLAYRYDHESNHVGFFKTCCKQFWSRVRTEIPLWHIHGIISTTTLFYGLMVIVASAFDLGALTDYAPAAALSLNAVAAIISGGYGLLALAKRRVRWLIQSSAILTLVYTYYSAWFLLSGITNAYQLITTIAFGAISVNVYADWVRIDKSTGQIGQIVDE